MSKRDDGWELKLVGIIYNVGVLLDEKDVGWNMENFLRPGTAEKALHCRIKLDKELFPTATETKYGTLDEPPPHRELFVQL